MRIRNSVYDHITKNADNLQYFRNQCFDPNSKNVKIPEPDVFRQLIQVQKGDNVEAAFVDVLAVSEIYNVRIIVHECTVDHAIVVPALRAYISCSNIPLILLAKGRVRNRTEALWGVIHQQNGVCHSICVVSCCCVI